jgi:membrane protease YdiL (CAAX protease family)
MGPAIGRVAQQHPLATFFVLAYGLTWLAAVPYAVGAFPVPLLPCGPLLAALVVTPLVGGWPATAALLRRMGRWRVGLRWYALALLLPFGVTAGAAGAAVALGAPAPAGDALLGRLPGLVPIFVFNLLFPLSGALGEEPGWRGFALPRLLAGRSPLAATLILGALVAGWHAPLFLTGQYGQVPLRVLFIVTTTVLYTLLANGSGGSVLLAMLFHAAWNAAAEFALPAFAGPDLDLFFALYLLGGSAVAVLAGLLAGAGFVRPPATRGVPAFSPGAA